MSTIWTFDGIKYKHAHNTRASNEDNKLWKEENDTINKQTAGIVWNDKS